MAYWNIGTALMQDAAIYIFEIFNSNTRRIGISNFIVYLRFYTISVKAKQLRYVCIAG